MADVMSRIAWMCVLTLSFTSFCSHANQGVPSDKGTSIVKTFVLPPGWKTKDPIRFTKRGSTIEYELSGAVHDSAAPEKLFSTYAISEKSKKPFISNYVTECIEGDAVIHPELFIFSKHGFKAGGFECQSEVNNALVIYLLKNNDKSDEYLVFTWNKKSNKKFSKKEIMIRLGYSLQSAVQFMICREGCALENLNNETQRAFYLFDKIKGYEKSMHGNAIKIDEHYYAFVLSIFGIFPSYIYEKNGICKATILNSFVKVCGFHNEKNQISVVDEIERITDASFPNLIGINIKEKNDFSVDFNCHKGELYPLSNKNTGIANFYEQKWFLCKDSSKTYSAISTITMDVGSKDKIIFEHVWDMPRDVGENINLYLDYINYEITKKSTSIYLCENNSYLYDC